MKTFLFIDFIFFILINQGFLKLVDMGTAKILKNVIGKESRTFTIIGTPHYMAPEVITGKGYSFLVDLWSIGNSINRF
jgi:cGMP-dependent protein kinase